MCITNDIISFTKFFHKKIILVREHASRDECLLLQTETWPQFTKPASEIRWIPHHITSSQEDQGDTKFPLFLPWNFSV